MTIIFGNQGLSVSLYFYCNSYKNILCVFDHYIEKKTKKKPSLSWINKNQPTFLTRLVKGNRLRLLSRIIVKLDNRASNVLIK